MTKLLIAEDECNACAAIAAYFEAQGFEVRSTANGCEAIRIAKDLRPDILICDWLLEGECSGVKVAQALANVKPRAIIILVSGYSLAELRSMTCDLDIRGYLEKPISLFELSALIDGTTGADTAKERPRCV